MGSKSRSNSRQVTNNTSTSIGVQGDNNGFITNGSGNTYNMTDGGLVSAIESLGAGLVDANIAGFDAAGNMTRDGFDFAGNVNRDSLDFAGDALSMTRNIAGDSINAQNSLTRDALAENGDLAREMLGLSAGINSDVIGFAGDTLNTTIGAIGDANARITDVASYAMDNSAQLAGLSIDAADNANARMTDVAVYSMDNASNLAKDLGAQVITATQDAYKDASDQTILAHKQALQFADHSTRSDGQQLAISTNKTMMYVMLGLGGMGMAVAMMRAN
ncbi:MULTISPECIES: hypothetical protein [unclassified Pseudoalteromonas]|uniref:hypothetical protein n=1 Tax=unclassified Pseudoalteromonas TaxID=194690 RepID=UPI001F20CF0F|nr:MULTISPECIES: hypothetical protein [unclassified Pseudoalteromonas]MCF2826819.1 hypothetical protein [Pseudoalteromonas sp. OF5H-5]MCF2924052.1 hypothetical protein [Pseudoalteromonas sp. DL2-H1]